MQKNIWRWAVTVALGGFVFGFDTAVISGATSIIREEWALSNLALGQMVAAALYGTIIGAVFGGLPADKYGRKKTLIGIAVLFLLSAIGSALAQDVFSLAAARFIGGVGVGASSVVAPLYITEVAPAKHRGRLVAMFQMNLVVGILAAYFSNFIVDALGFATSWRLMLGVEILPALAFLYLLRKVPNSPRWLLTKANRPEEAKAVLDLIYPHSDITINNQRDEAVRQFDLIQKADESDQTIALGTFFSRKYRRPITYAFLFALFNQISGINAVIYFAPDIFAAAGLERSAALLSSVGIGIINVAFTLLGLYLIDRAGRKLLMYIGSLGYIVSLSLIAYAFLSGNGTHLVPLWVFAFIASHAIGQGAVIWVFLSEIFGNEVRSLGASLGSATHWVFAALIGGNFPYLVSLFGEGMIFAVFAVCMVGQLIWVYFVMPETKGVDLEILQRELEGGRVQDASLLDASL